MLGWIIYHRENALYNQQYIRFYLEEGAKQGIDFRLLLVEDLEFGIQNGQWFIIHQKEILPKPDFVICRAIYPLLTKQLEYMWIPVFNDSFVSEICNDKAKTYQYLAQAGIKMVDSRFYRKSMLREVIEQIETPTVIKSVDGHGGKQVFLLPGKPQLLDLEYKDEIIRKLSGSDVVVQPLTGTKNQDLRVYVIGKEIIAAVLRTAKEGFKSNFSLGGEVGLYSLSSAEMDLVYRIINRFDFGLVGIDFIIGDEGELIFNEIEDVVGSRMLYQCSDINIVEKYLSFIKNRVSMQ